MKIAVIIFSIFFANCAIKQPIKYNMKEIQKTDKKINAVLSIETFLDKRKEHNLNPEQFTMGREAKLNGIRYCINSEKHYKENSVPMQMTKILAKHLNTVAIFDTVLVNAQEKSDYILKGEIIQFFGKEPFSTSKAVGAQFGLVGALIGSAVDKSDNIESEYNIEISNLAIYNKLNEILFELNPIKTKLTDKITGDGYCWQVYWNMNMKLKEEFKKLANNIESFEQIKDESDIGMRTNR